MAGVTGLRGVLRLWFRPMTDRRASWAALAGELGFDFKPGVRQFLESPAGQRELEERVARHEIPSPDLSILENPLVMLVLDRMFVGGAVGTYQGFDVALYPSSSSSASSNTQTHYSNVVLFFREPYALQLKLYNQTFMSSIGKFLFAQQDVQLGEPALDDLLMVKGRDEMAVRRLLDSRQVRDQLLAMFAESRGYTINDRGVQHREAAAVITRERAVSILDGMAVLASALPPP
jgi:hypothetical protein